MNLSSYRLNAIASSSTTKILGGVKGGAKWTRGVIGAAATTRIIRSTRAACRYAAFRANDFTNPPTCDLIST